MGKTTISKGKPVIRSNWTSKDMIYHQWTGTKVSNDSGLINITDCGIDSNNASGIQVSCSTSNYRVSNPILWSNGNYYVVLFGWNNATFQKNITVNIVLSWFSTVS